MKRLRNMFFRTTAALALFGAAHAHAAAPISPGEWEYTMKMRMEMKGVPMTMPEMTNTFTSCVTAKDPTVEPPEMRKVGCKMINKKTKGKVFSYTARCTQDDSVIDMNYRITYTATSMKGEFDQVRKVGGEVQGTAKGTMSGKRVGPCKSKK